MQTFLYSTPQRKVILWLSDYIKNNSCADLHFNKIMSILKQENNYYLRCVLIDNKYLYGSFLAAARERLLSC